MNYRTGSIVFDIETIPDQNKNRILEKQQKFFDEYKVSSSLSKAELAKKLKLSPDEEDYLSKTDMQQKYKPEAKQAAWDKVYRDTALDGGLGEIISIAWMSLDDQHPFCITRRLEEPESDLLNQFNEDMSHIRSDGNNRYKELYFIGHNIEGFDLKFLWKRMLVNGIKPCFKLPINGRHEHDYYDTMIGWGGRGYGDKSRKSLDFVCQALGIGGKDDIDGSKIWDLVKEGKYTEITNYNLDDIDKAFKLYKRLKFIED